ncbi:hypothetical protein EXU48_10820 [Occultella glacieicola]|uniref:Lipoprotein n=1 Tax=Occultella glacieicola TaxID=2518684 RepID=A0ABY2E2Y0_9MICO|nr:hypothetical protein [Occultella glacieicola]TDE93950.1 hypothetical protein EXU48_10820 [Occultella glacieicola]
MGRPTRIGAHRGRRAVPMILAAAVLAALATLSGCANSPAVTLGPAPSPAVDPDGAAADLQTLLTELYGAFLIGDPDATTIISADATGTVAVAELDEALSLGGQVEAFAAATGAELAHLAEQSPRTPTGVRIEVTDATVVGTEHDRPVATVDLVTTITQRGGATREAEVEFLVGWGADGLTAVWAVERDGTDVVRDSGAGLGSPTGAVDRFLRLALNEEWEALEQFSGGVNASDTELAVFASVAAAAGRHYVLELPQERAGDTHVVYIVGDSNQVIGRFDVVLGEDPRVVYFPTA